MTATKTSANTIAKYRQTHDFLPKIHKMMDFENLTGDIRTFLRGLSRGAIKIKWRGHFLRIAQ